MKMIRRRDIDRTVLLGREIDDLLLRLRGLVLVRDLLADRGATRSEVDAHTHELERVRRQLMDRLRGGDGPVFGEAA
jgi:hypothetical protein